jgi:hypothetical protein
MDAVTNDVSKLRGRRETRNRVRDDVRETRQKLANSNGIKPEFEYEYFVPGSKKKTLQIQQ